MNRIQKKCLIASGGLHALLLLVIAFGAAFHSGPKPVVPQQRLNVVPSRIVEAMIAGGGGNPNIPQKDEMVRGNTLQSVPPPIQQPPKPTVQPPKPVPPIDPPRPPTKPSTEPRTVAKAPEASKPTPAAPPVAKPPEKLVLTPAVRTDAAKESARKEAEAREAARVAANQRRELANQLGRALDNVKAGFHSGTAVEVGGLGGEAFANYAFLVEAAYRDAMQSVTDFSDQEYTVKVEVIIARSGRVVSSRILRRSNNAVMDRAVQRAVDKVQSQGLKPFPPEARDSERKFTIEYSFRARRATG